MSAALQAYADRGVFRGLRAEPGPRGRVEFQFLWLTRPPMRATLDARRRTLSFPALFPGVDAAAAATLKEVAGRTARDQPVHKRLDARRARISGGVRRGDFSLAVEIRGANGGYAVGKALNLINDLFLSLREAHPGYLVDRFGMSTE